MLCYVMLLRCCVSYVRLCYVMMLCYYYYNVLVSYIMKLTELSVDLVK